MTITVHDRARLASDILIDLNAIHCSPEKPYILTSGWASPVYVNCRRIISATWQRRAIIQMAAEMVEKNGGCGRYDVVAGGETAGIPFAAWIADYFYRPMIYVRKKSKGFGLGRQIEGELSQGQRVLFVEDLMTDGASKITFASSLREAGGAVSDVLVVFNYGIYPDTGKHLAEAGLSVMALTDWRSTIEAAKLRGYFNAGQVKVVEAFLADPAGWSRAHGGVSA